jgi:outer membrane protein TolC
MRTSDTINLEQILQEAEEKNPLIQGAAAAVDAKRANISPSAAFEDPLLKYEVENLTEGDADRQSKFLLSQKFPFPGKLSAKGRAAEQTLNAEQQRARQVKNQITRDIKVAFFKLCNAFKRLQILSDQKALIQQVFAVAKQNFSTGKLPKVDLLNLQIEEATVVDKILLAKQEIESAQGDISHLIGRTSHNDYLFGKPEDFKPTAFDLTKVSESQLADFALTTNPKYLTEKATSAAASEEVRFARLNYLPDFEVEAGYAPARAGRGNKDSYSASIGVSLPVWAGVKQSDLRDRALAEKTAAESRMRQELIEVSHEIHLLYAQLKEIERRQQLFDSAFIPLSKQAVASVQSSYLAGKSDYATLLETIRKRFELEISASEAAFEREMILAELEYMVGAPLGDFK